MYYCLSLKLHAMIYGFHKLSHTQPVTNQSSSIQWESIFRAQLPNSMHHRQGSLSSTHEQHAQRQISKRNFGNPYRVAVVLNNRALREPLLRARAAREGSGQSKYRLVGCRHMGKQCLQLPSLQTLTVIHIQLFCYVIVSSCYNVYE